MIRSGASFDRPTDPDIPPSAWVMRWASLIRPGGTVLDVAAGHGRHTRALAALGFTVTAADIEVSGLAGAPAEVVAADLETGVWPFKSRTFDGIVITNYLHRPHFPHLLESLAAEGVLIFETFGQGNERLGRPRNPNFLLAPGELLRAFEQLSVVAYEHGEEQAPRPAVRQRLCAVKGAAPRVIG
ncbi:MAG: class I SAM-dependent methyltransferase [Rhodospirillaceae bacterium]|nr:class I SAM-dependent methyltransferase [Rhodospirillaceae bacterium]